MRKILLFLLFAGFTFLGKAQVTITLDSCRALALRNNKQLNVSKLKQDVALNLRKAAKTLFLPKIDAVGGYEFFSKEVSILNDGQKSALSSLGTNAVNGLNSNLSTMISGLVQKGLISPQTAQELGSIVSQLGTPLAKNGDDLGQNLVDAFRTDTRNIWSGAVLLRQPLYMGGAIIAADKIAKINEKLASDEVDGKIQATLYSIDQAYWMTVSLRQKQKLANSYHDLVKKLSDDVHKMINEGVATRADGLKVDVKVNEAEMQMTQVENGLSLSKMLLCQLCGMPMDSDIRLADEDGENLFATEEDIYPDNTYTDSVGWNNRHEVRMLQDMVDISRESTKIVRAAYLPQVMLTGGYIVSNPNTFNGFERKFAGVWNMGVLVRVPIWNWFEGTYKVRASKAATSIASMELNEVQEKIELQINQSKFQVNEAYKKLVMARKNVKSAEENLRCANLGFKEGVIDATDVMTAQTAWQQALTQKIDAEIDVKLTRINLKKALGILQ